MILRTGISLLTDTWTKHIHCAISLELVKLSKTVWTVSTWAQRCMNLRLTTKVTRTIYHIQSTLQIQHNDTEIQSTQMRSSDIAKWYIAVFIQCCAIHVLCTSWFYFIFIFLFDCILCVYVCVLTILYLVYDFHNNNSLSQQHYC